MNEIVFDISRIIATIVGLILAYYIIPAIKLLVDERIDAETKEFIKACVYAAEQSLKTKDGSPNGTMKKKFVEKEVAEWLTKKGISITDTQLDILIESAVLAMKTEVAK